MKLIAAKTRYRPRPITGMGDGRICVNSRYFTVDGTPVLPVMGEFHYSRYPAAEWKREIEKMRAGGVGIVSCYVFWIHHEERRGEWDFSGSRCLRDFVKTCAGVGMPLVLRIGPFVHGECRNGGLPDWIVADEEMEERTNDPRYLACVREYFGKIGEQIKGYLHEDGGPILGIQIENEYGCVGGPRDSAVGKAHMHTLKQLANECGISAPFYTATAWGGAHIADGEMLPVHGGYVDAPWAGHTTKEPTSRLFLLESFLDDGNIATDWKRDDDLTDCSVEPDEYPFLTAEMGGGLQVTHHRRTYPTGHDIEAAMLSRLAGGANLIGYYMYHGGVNPVGKYSTYQESKATHYGNDLPIMSYDFFAPLGESGEMAESYGMIKKLHLFLGSFGDRLAPCSVREADEKPTGPEDTGPLRALVRCDTRPESRMGGFVFINNHIRGISMPDRPDTDLTVVCPDGEEIHFPPVCVMRDGCYILPYRFEMGEGNVLRSSNATPLCRYSKRWFFWCDGEAIYDFESGSADVVALTRADAERAYLFCDGLYLSDAQLYRDGDTLFAESTEEKIEVIKYAEEGAPEPRTYETAPVTVHSSYRAVTGLVENGHPETFYDGDYIEYEIKIDYPENRTLSRLVDVFLDIGFDGDRAELYDGDTLVADRFATGRAWHAPLKRLGYPTVLRLRVYAPTEPFYHDLPINEVPDLGDVRALPLYGFAID